ncbi:hypothetical protein PPERSA_03687 [Pseudocohnilembus persalinus]|uniref:Uncharacterized protein n=1 Tax=Pseudocohnilembus persalinus TaxID=266149 RepID=A0A0V0QG46_PSEPJ|nr:hypothetical protein PPERSA_03687 [Pseudocohnilembus persalinus]|eukprot:KRX01183.1 hypothetical protein PPERSA_03687 [Pseudocohnilembus persalinus]
MKTSQCSKPEHFGQQYKICRKCIKLYNQKPKCYIDQCSEDLQQLLFNKSEFYLGSTNAGLIKAMYLNLYDQSELNPVKFRYGTLMLFAEQFSKNDVFQYTQNAKDHYQGANEDFMGYYNVPSFFQTVQLPGQKLLLTGGIYKIFQQKEESNEEVKQNEKQDLPKFQEYFYSNSTYIIDLNSNQLETNFSTYNNVIDNDKNNSDEEKIIEMNDARIGHQMVLHNSIPYVIGGKNSEKTLNSVEFLDAKYNWNYIEPMNQGRARFAAVSFVDEKNKKQFIYVIGGQSDNNVLTKSAEKYDFEQKKWINLEIVSQSFVSMGGYAFQHPNNHRMYIVGGVLNNEKASDKIFELVEKEGKLEFIEIGKLNTPQGDIKGTLTKYYDDIQQEVKSNSKIQINVFTGYLKDKNEMGIESFEIDSNNQVIKQQNDSVHLGSVDQNLLYQANHLIPINSTGRIKQL